jgi:hypothetical protein
MYNLLNKKPNILKEKVKWNQLEKNHFDIGLQKNKIKIKVNNFNIHSIKYNL